VSTRRVEKITETLGITSLAKSRVSELAKSLDQAVEQFRSWPMDRPLPLRPGRRDDRAGARRRPHPCWCTR
jgi:transposase-like protein